MPFLTEHLRWLLLAFQSESKVAGNFIKKENLAQVCSCELCEISKNALFTEHLLDTASD